MKNSVQISFTDVTTSKYKQVDFYDNIDGVGHYAHSEFIPIPRKGDILTIAKLDDSEPEDPMPVYKVVEVKYNYKHFFDPESVIVYIDIRIKRI